MLAGQYVFKSQGMSLGFGLEKRGDRPRGETERSLNPWYIAGGCKRELFTIVLEGRIALLSSYNLFFARGNFCVTTPLCLEWDLY